MSTTGEKPDRYAVVGHPIDHSRSPVIHQLFAKQTEQNIVYELIDAMPNAFETAVRGFAAASGKGMNCLLYTSDAADDDYTV